MSEVINIDAEVMGYIHRGVKKIILSDGGELIFVLTDGEEYNFGRIVGDKGDKGDRGDRGEKGDKGDKGEPGEKGDTGDFPFYILEWDDPQTEAQRQDIIDKILEAESKGVYNFFLHFSSRYIPLSSFMSLGDGTIMVIFTDHCEEYLKTFVLTINRFRGSLEYSQKVSNFGIEDLDDEEFQMGLATAEGVKAYVGARLDGISPVDLEALI